MSGLPLLHSVIDDSFQGIRILTPKAPGEGSPRRDRVRNYLGRGTWGLGPDCNTLLRKCEKETQRRWLQSRVADLMRSKIQPEPQQSARERYTSRRTEVDRLKEGKEEQMEKICNKNAACKKEKKSLHVNRRKQASQEIRARVGEDREKQKKRWIPLWQWHDLVWNNFPEMLSREIENNKDHSVVDLPGGQLGASTLRLTFKNSTMTATYEDEDSQSWKVRRKLSIPCAQSGFCSQHCEESVDQFKQMCLNLRRQIQEENDQFFKKRAETTEVQKERRLYNKAQRDTGGKDRMETLRRSIVCYRERFQKKQRVYKDKDVESKQMKTDEIREMRRQKIQRRMDKQELFEKFLEARTRDFKNKLNIETSRRNEIDRKAIACRRELVERQREENSYCPTTVEGIALSKAQVRVRDDRVSNAREVNDSKNRYRLEREADMKDEKEWKLFLSSTVKKTRQPGSSFSPLSSPISL